MILAQDICSKLNLDSSVILKKPIRGKNGFTTLELIDALINNDTIIDAATKLGYSDNPLKQVIRTLLKPILGISHGDNWRKKLLSLIKHKYCNQCNRILPYSMYTKDCSRDDQLANSCASCRVLKSKREKEYILQRTPSWSELELIKRFYINCPIGYHVDHIVWATCTK
ncbi:MAG: hypothetical protein BWY21_00082 [Parcubacteria group bacterium ADurb.Bin216]|nr:MAG: hypothetical protein BWY21_00082 [Parcubacteria group bacterium ADurb.Bin216]